MSFLVLLSHVLRRSSVSTGLTNMIGVMAGAGIATVAVDVAAAAVDVAARAAAVDVAAAAVDVAAAVAAAGAVVSQGTPSASTESFLFDFATTESATAADAPLPAFAALRKPPRTHELHSDRLGRDRRKRVPREAPALTQTGTQPQLAVASTSSSLPL